MDLGSWGKKTFKRSEQIKKKNCKNLVWPLQFYTLYEPKFSNLRHFFQLLFSKVSKNLKSLDIGLREVGAKRPLNGGRNTNTKKNPAQWGKICSKTIKFLRCDFTPFIIKSFKIWDHFFPLLFPKDSKFSKIFGHLTSGSGGIRTFECYLKSKQTYRQTHTHMDKSTYRKHQPRGPMLWKKCI